MIAKIINNILFSIGKYTACREHAFIIEKVHNSSTQIETLSCDKLNVSDIPLKKVTDLLTKPNTTHIIGLHREFIFDATNNVAYKFIMPEMKSTHVLLNDLSIELRLNEIYKNEKFYEGKYAKFGNIELITLIDDRMDIKNKIKCLTFNWSADAIPLEKNETIPKSAIDILEELKYLPIDIKPANFVKFKNKDGSFDYIPIDAKLIGSKKSNSTRSIFVKSCKATSPYLHESQFIRK